jgi:hypothetical protein
MMGFSHMKKSWWNLHPSSGYLQSGLCFLYYEEGKRGTKLAVQRVRVKSVLSFVESWEWQWSMYFVESLCFIWAVFERNLESQESLQNNLVLPHNSIMSHDGQWQSRPTEEESLYFAVLINLNCTIYMFQLLPSMTKSIRVIQHLQDLQMNSLQLTAQRQWWIIDNLSSEPGNCKFSFLSHWWWNDTY